MNEKELISFAKRFNSILRPEQHIKILYLFKAWKKLSHTIEDDLLKFNYFCNKEINMSELEYAINKLSKTIKVFDYFLKEQIPLSQLLKNDLNMLFRVANEVDNLPNICDIFYSSFEHRGDFLVPNQVANLGVKLLGRNYDVIYSPFSNSYNIGYYTNKKIFAESFANQYVIELIKIVENINIEFSFSDPLISPAYTNPQAQDNTLQKFACVLSFPPIGMPTNNTFLHTDKFGRFQFHKSKTNCDVAYFEHIISQTSEKAILLTHVGFTYRSSQDEEFRQYLISNNWLEAVIQFPPNLHSATSIETTFIVINKNKTTDSVYFLNLKHESFLQRDGRKLILKDINYIVSLYETKQELENISKLISLDEIKKNNYSFAIDRFIVSNKINEIKQELNRFKLVDLEELAEVRRSQLVKDEEVGKEIYEVSPSDFPKSGFMLECGKIKQIGSQYKKLQTYKLEPYDVLLSTKGTIGKVAIVGDIYETMIASQSVQVIRLKCNNKKQKAIVLYMFLKSVLGQSLLSTLVSGVAMPQIATTEIKKLKVPILSNNEDEKIIEDFNNEVNLLQKIEELTKSINAIHDNFLGAKQ